MMQIWIVDQAIQMLNIDLHCTRMFTLDAKAKVHYFWGITQIVMSLATKIESITCKQPRGLFIPF